MNIFFLDENPSLSAQYHCDKHVVKMMKHHKSSDVIRWCMLNLPPIKDVGFTKPPLAMPEKYKVDDHVLSYRNYYIGDKYEFTTWKNRDTPEWFLNEK